MDRRTWATSLGIAVAVLLPVGGQLLLDGLASGVETAASRFPAPPVLLLGGDTLSESSIDAALAAATPGWHLDLRVVEAMLLVRTMTTDVYAAAASVTDEGGTRPWIPVASGDVRFGDRLLDALSVAPNPGDVASFETAGSSVNLTYRGSYSAADGVPALWAILSEDGIVALDPVLTARVSAILVPAGNVAGLAYLRSAGLREAPTLGGSRFVTTGVAQAGAALQDLSLVSAVVVGLLVVHGMAVEVLQRGGEISILRQLGASPRRVAALYAAQAFYISALGGAIGTALGVIAAHAVVSFAPLAGLSNLVVLGAPLSVLGMGLLFAIVPGAAASLGPARIAGRVYRRPRGAMRSS